jgi:putative FmdB family regulatory protein
MPIFEYVCSECHTRFEHLQRGSARPTCPDCRSEQLEKQLSVFAVNAKGTTPSGGRSFGPCGTCGDPRGPGACSN